MNQEEAGEILRANVKNLSEPLKSAVEFALTNFFMPSAADLAKKFLASLPSMTTEDAELKSRIDSAYFTLMNDEKSWLSLENLPHEEWRDVIGYEGLYKVSNLGRVKSLKYEKEKIVKHYVNKSGYLSVCLSKNNKTRTSQIHRLIAKAFLSNPEKKPTVNHRFGKKFDNRVSEIEWATRSENSRHAVNMGLRKSGYNHPKSKLNKDERELIKKICIPGDSKFGFKALAPLFNVEKTTIRKVYYLEMQKNVT